MAMMPASTIQVLGAEKAMFRSIKTKARPPKHGLLFQHPYVHGAPRSRRGSRARSLAAKIAIGARADVFSGEFIADDLRRQLMED
jgi:nucleolar protein 56